MPRITNLVVPGLLGPMPRLDHAACPRYLLLERLTARSDKSAAAVGYAETLFELFGLPLSDEQDLPTAALAYLADTGRSPEGVVYHADPVHLLPDQDRLLLFDTPAADLTANESAAFTDAVNRHFVDDGWRLEAPVPGRWYLHLERSPQLRTQPLGLVVGRNIDLFRPQGADARYWQQRLNEVQMLFHGLSVNEQRALEGRLPVSGLWLHGGGALPAAVSSPFQRIETEDVLLTGLAALAGTGTGDESLEVWLDAWRAVQDADPQAWQQALAELEEQVSGLLAEGSELRLYPCNGVRHLYQARHRYRLWRRPGPFANSLQAEPDQTR